MVDHCNLDCVGCSHESPFMPRRCEDPNVLQRALEVLWKCYRAPLLKLLGGEPLLHPAIDEIIYVAKSCTSAQLRLVTNGTLLERRYAFLQGIDEIHISSYPGTVTPDDMTLCHIASELNAPITVQAFGHFRWHRSLPRRDPNLTKQVFATCQMFHAWECHTLREGWLYPCPPAGTWGSNRCEGINLFEDSSDLQENIIHLLRRDTPLMTCNECLGSVGQLLKHQLGWRNRANHDQEHVIDSDFTCALELDSKAYNSCFQYQRTVYPTGDVKIY